MLTIIFKGSLGPNICSWAGKVGSKTSKPGNMPISKRRRVFSSDASPSKRNLLALTPRRGPEPEKAAQHQHKTNFVAKTHRFDPSPSLFGEIERERESNHVGEAPTDSRVVLFGVQFAGRVLRVRTRFRKMQALVDPKRSEPLPGSHQRSRQNSNPNSALFFFLEFFKSNYMCFLCAEANAKEADRVTEQLQSTGISSDGATPSGMLLLLVLILSF
jgi:hypothetical protein